MAKKATLTDQLRARVIRELTETDTSERALAALLGVSQPTVRSFRLGESNGGGKLIDALFDYFQLSIYEG